MTYPNVFKFSRLKRRLKRYQIYWDQDKGKGSHGSFIGPDKDGNSQSYTIPLKQQNETEKVYLKGVCNRFGLDPDELFS
jgi:hypothetical protein